MPTTPESYLPLLQPRPAVATPLPAAPPQAPIRPLPDPNAQAANPFADIQAKVSAMTPEQRAVLAKQLEATQGPAPPIPDFETAEQAALGERRAANAQAVTNPQPADDGASGWNTFLNTISDPTSSANFLFTAGTNLLQPRSEAESSLGFGMRGLGTAADRLSQARAARSAAQLEAQKTQADIAKTGQDIRSAQAKDTLIPSEIELNKAQAFAARMKGASEARTPLPAAEVQSLQFLGSALRRLAPDVYTTDEAALVAAHMLRKPDTTRADFVADYVTQNSIFYDSPDQATAEANALADQMGMTEGGALSDILSEQRRREILQNPDAAFDYFRSQRPDATYEQVQAAVLRATGRRSSRPSFNTAAPAAEAPEQTENERKLEIAQTMRNLDRLSREEIREFFNRYNRDLSGPQRLALTKRLGTVE